MSDLSGPVAVVLTAVLFVAACWRAMRCSASQQREIELLASEDEAGAHQEQVKPGVLVESYQSLSLTHRGCGGRVVSSDLGQYCQACGASVDDVGQLEWVGSSSYTLNDQLRQVGQVGKPEEEA